MPTYDYVCDACKHAFEEFQTMSAKSLKKCPSCGKPKLRRLMGTGAGFIFKGGGFYETDYRSEGYKKDAKADKADKADSDTGKSAGDKSETKSEPSANKAEAAPAKSESKSQSKSQSQSKSESKTSPKSKSKND